MNPAPFLLALRLAASVSAVEISTATPRPIDLPEAFTLALKRSELLAEDREAVAQALARVDELRGDVMPHVALIGQETLQQSPGGSVAAVNQTSIPSVYFQLTQPLFSGFREFLAFKAGKKQARSLEMTEKRAESLLYQDVATAYLDLLRVQKEIAIRAEILDATQERIKQLDHWVRIGRSRESEVLAARSQQAQTEALIEIARGQERVSQEVLGFLTGLDADFRPQDMPVPAPEILDGFLARARHRSDVEAQERGLDVAQLNSEIARRQRWPTIGLTADYYLKRTGFTANTHYDAILAANLPLFTGGVIGAQVRENEAAERAAAQALSLVRRAAERDVRSSFRTLEWTLSAVRALDKAATLAQANLKAQMDDYKLSLVTNLQVLDSLTALQSTRITLSQNQVLAALSRIQLEVAAGLPPRRGA